MPTLADEVTFISSINADGTLAYSSFGSWNSDSPPTYGGGYTNAAKWGAPTAGTPGGAVSYYLPPSSNWSATEQQAIAATLALWSAETNISFVQTTSSSSAKLVIERGNDGSAGTSYRTSGGSGAGLTGGTTLYNFTRNTISIDTSVPGFGPIGASFTTDGGYPWTTLLHEEGHALGLGHAGPYNEGTNSNNFDQAQFSPYDTRLWSLMSYLDPNDTSAAYYSQYPVTGTSWGNSGGYPDEPTTPMALDILAAQQLYGLPTSTPLSGGQTFGFNSNIVGLIRPFFDFTQNTKPVVTLWDMGANNTLDLSGFNSAATVNLNPGTFSSCDALTNNICIAFNTAIDSYVGSNGVNTVICNNDGDTLSFGNVNSQITGGSGDDLVNPGLGNSVFNGGAGVDIVSISDPYADFTISQNGDGSIHLSGMGVADTFSNVEFLSFSDLSIAIGGAAALPFDFNLDGNSDILWQNSDGTAAIWFMNGAATTGGGLVGINPGPSWHLESSGDFDGDGHADLAWQNNDGTVAVWLMNGASQTSGAVVGSNPGPGWQLTGTGDFDGDGKSDLLFQNTNGQAAIWLMNGTVTTGGGLVGGNPGPGWHIKATGDFNGDGKSDILWQNDSGQAAIWLMNGSTVTGGGLVGSNPGPSWHVIGAGDFNGDGKSDILWQNSDGTVAIWLMNGTVVAGGGLISTNPGPSWQAMGTGDYNGDGMADILWQNTDGTPAVWLMNGTSVLGSGGLPGSNPGTSWHVIATGGG